MTRTLFSSLQAAASICRAADAGVRTRRLLAKIDLLRAAVAISAVEEAPEEDRDLLAELVLGVHAEALELTRDCRLAREAAAAMMD